MKTKLVITLCAVLSFSTFFGQNPSFAWAHNWGSPSFDNATKVITDAAGDVYFVGTFQNTVDFDPSPSVFTLTAIGASNTFFCKLDALGEFVWAKSIPSPSPCTVFDMTFDPAGNLRVTGSFWSTVDFDLGAGTYTLQSSGNADAFLLTLDAQGNFVQAVSFGTPGPEHGKRIHCDVSGNVYVSGLYLGVCDFDPGPGTYTVSAGIDGYAFIAKYDASYSLQWVEAWGKPQGSGGGLNANNMGIVTDGAFNVYISGSFAGGPSIDVAPGPVLNAMATGTSATAGQSNRDIFLTKLTSNGTYCWTKLIGDVLNDEANSILIKGPHIYLSGYYQLAPDFDPGPTTASLTSLGLEDAFVLKLDTAANYSWAKSIGSTTADISYALGMNNAGNIYFTGVFGSVMDCDPNAGVFNVTSAGGDDAFVSGLDPSGNFIWATSYGGPANEASRSISVLPGGAIHTAGNFYGTCNFDPTASNYTITEVGASDAFVHKLNLCLTPITVSVTLTPSVVCPSQSFTMYLSGATNYTLAKPTGTMILWNNNFITSILSTTTYTLYGRDANGCTSSAVITQSVSTCTQISENNQQPMSNIYPNPFSDKIVIESDHNDVIEITDLWGKTVYKKEIAEGRETIDLSKCSNGLYFVRTGSRSLRLIKMGQ